MIKLSHLEDLIKATYSAPEGLLESLGKCQKIKKAFDLGRALELARNCNPILEEETEVLKGKVICFPHPAPQGLWGAETE